MKGFVYAIPCVARRGKGGREILYYSWLNIEIGFIGWFDFGRFFGNDWFDEEDRINDKYDKS